MSSLYSVAMPLGNSDDITLRAVKILESVDIIAAEDTRKFRDWAARVPLRPAGRVFAHHSKNESRSAGEIIRLIKEGSSAALVTDAGTPRLSDPGFRLIREAHEEGIQVVPVPGPSALTALVSIAPVQVDPLLFLGFLTPKKQRRLNILGSYADYKGSVLFYESVHRIEALLYDIHEAWGEVEIFIGRELTKQFEEYYWGTTAKAIDWVQAKKGEFCLIAVKNSKN